MPVALSAAALAVLGASAVPQPSETSALAIVRAASPYVPD